MELCLSCINPLEYWHTSDDKIEKDLDYIFGIVALPLVFFILSDYSIYIGTFTASSLESYSILIVCLWVPFGSSFSHRQ